MIARSGQGGDGGSTGRLVGAGMGKIRQERMDWTRVEFGDGRKGWISKMSRRPDVQAARAGWLRHGGGVFQKRPRALTGFRAGA